MAQRVVRINDLPAGALDAAAAFHAMHLAPLRQALAGDAQSLVVILPPADQDHAGWRRAVVQDLARAHAPARVNFVAGKEGAAVERTIAWLGEAPGVTGQLLQAD